MVIGHRVGEVTRVRTDRPRRPPNAFERDRSHGGRRSHLRATEPQRNLFPLHGNILFISANSARTDSLHFVLQQYCASVSAGSAPVSCTTFHAHGLGAVTAVKKRGQTSLDRHLAAASEGSGTYAYNMLNEEAIGNAGCMKSETAA